MNVQIYENERDNRICVWNGNLSYSEYEKLKLTNDRKK